MAKKTIPQLDDVTNTQTPDAEVAISQNGFTFRGRIRPNPTFQINVTSQTQLEAKFGTSIIIPDGENWTIMCDDSFTLTKPFKIGSGTSLEVTGATINTTITYTGTGALFQNENLANPIAFLTIKEIKFIGDGTNSFFDIVGNNLLFTLDIDITNFDSLGIVDSMFNGILRTNVFTLKKGIIFKNPQALVCDVFSIQNTPPSSPPLTFITVITSGTPQVEITNCFIFDTAASVVFFDPNAAAGSAYIIANNKGAFANLFQQGAEQPVTTVIDNLSGFCTFIIPVGDHGYNAGQAIVLSGFTEPTYNVTAIVQNDLDGLFFDTDIPFVGNASSGTVKGESLDSTDPVVTAASNSNTPNSMITGNAALELSAFIIATINTEDEPEPIISALWTSNNLERISEDIVTIDQGRLVINDLATRRYTVTYSATLDRSGGGGALNIGIVLLKNGSLVGVNPPRSFLTGAHSLTRTDIIELTTDDVLQVAVISRMGSSDIEVYQADLTLSLA